MGQLFLTGRNIQNERLLTSHDIERKFVGNSLIVTDQIRAELEIVVFAMHYSRPGSIAL
jgi:hypothetical protein